MKIKTYNNRISASIQPRKMRNYQLIYRIDGKRFERSLQTKDLQTARYEAIKIIEELKKSIIGGTRLSEMKELWLKYNSGKSNWYKKDIDKHFQPFIDYFNDCSAEILTMENLYQYRNHLERKIAKRSKRPLSPTTISIAFGTIKSVWNFNRRIEKISNDIFLNFKFPKRLEKKEWLNLEQLEEVIKAADDNPLYQGFLELLIYTGMRIGELYKLKWSNIYASHIILEKTKRGENDIIKMREDIAETLKKINLNQRIHKIFVFSSSNGKHFSYDTANKIVKRYLRKAGFPNHTPHCLRHSYATNLILKGTDIYRVKELMRHNSVITTQKYIKFTGMDISEEEATIIEPQIQGLKIDPNSKKK